MSMKLTALAMDVRVGNPLRKLVLLKLCDNADEKGRCWPSVKYIADQCEISERSVKSHIADLEAAGFLRIIPRSTGGKKISNLYLIDLAGKPQVSGVESSKNDEFSSAGDALLGDFSSAGDSNSSAGAALRSSAGAAPKPVIQPVKEPINKKIYKKICLDSLSPEISPEVAQEFIDLRERQKNPLTQGAFDRAMREALRGDKFGLSADDVIRECVDAGWRGIKLQWVLNRRGASQPQPRGSPVGLVGVAPRGVRDVGLSEQLNDKNWAR